MDSLVNTWLTIVAEAESPITFYKIRSGFYLLVVFVLEFVYLVRIHSFEVDGLHHGIMYTAAVASYEGAVPHRDFYSQYGPGAPFLHGLWFRLTEPTLWSLQVFTSLLWALIGTLIFFSLRTKFSTLTSVLLSSLWVLTGPWGLPWSSVITTLITLICMLILRNFFMVTKKTNNYLSLTLVGTLLAIGFYTRIHMGVTFIMIALTLLLICKSSGNYRAFYFLCIGFVSTFMVIGLILLYHGALYFYIQECILWVSDKYVGAHWGFKISTLFELSWIPISGIATFFLISIYLFLINRSIKLLWLSTILFASLLIILVPVSDLERTGLQSLRNPKILIITASEKAQFVISYVLLTLFILTISHKVFQRYRLGIRSLIKERIKGDSLLQSSIGVASLSQLYPFPDNYHIAFITPILILALVFGNPSIKLKINIETALRFYALTLVPALILHFLVLSNIPRNEFQAESLKGMYGSWLGASALDETMIELQKEEGKFRFICGDGIYAGSSGRYLSRDRDFFNAGPPVEKRDIFDRVFLCYVNEEVIRDYQNQGWDIVFRVYWPGMIVESLPSWNVLFERN